MLFIVDILSFSYFKIVALSWGYKNQYTTSAKSRSNLALTRFAYCKANKQAVYIPLLAVVKIIKQVTITKVVI